jgi:hypothetical protein
MIITRGFSVDVIKIIYVPIVNPVTTANEYGEVSVRSTEPLRVLNTKNKNQIPPSISSDEVLVDIDSTIYKPIITIK